MADGKRLSKVAREMGIGISTIVDYLASHDIEIDSDPKTKINEGKLNLLSQKFNTKTDNLNPLKIGLFKWFDIEKGFGVIVTTEGDEVFLHKSNWKDEAELSASNSIPLIFETKLKGGKIQAVKCFYFRNDNKTHWDVLSSAKRYKINLNRSSINILTLIINKYKTELDNSNVDEFISNKLQIFGSNNSFCEETIELIKVFTGIDEGYSEKIIKNFNDQLLELEEDFNEIALTEFLIKWTLLYPDHIRIQNIKHYEFKNLYIQLWLDNKLPLEFFLHALFDCFVSYVISDEVELEQIFNSLHPNRLGLIKDKYNDLFKTSFLIDSLEVYEVLEALLEEFSHTGTKKEELEKLLKASVNEDLQYELWIDEKIDVFPIEFAIRDFKHLNSNQQEKVINKLSDEELLPLLKDLKPIEDLLIIDRISTLKEELIMDSLMPVAFDIESNKEKVFEIAWNEGKKWFSFQNESIKEGIAKFKEVAVKDSILVGHNILNFDLPILKELEQVNYNDALVWDTLQVEKVLSPELKTYALNTKHTAKEDAQHTLKLFQNQLLRVLILDEYKFEQIKAVLSEVISTKLNSIKEELKFKLDSIQLNKDKLLFFRPQPKTNPVLSQLNDLIAASEANNKVILGTGNMVSDLLSYGKVTFSSNLMSNQDFQIIDTDQILIVDGIDNSQRAQLNSYITSCKIQEVIPYWANVSPSIRIDIEEKTDVWSLFTKQETQLNNIDNPRFLVAGELEEYFKGIKGDSKTELFVLQPDLISISQKELIKKVDIEQLKALFQDNYFWMKFSGGQSVVTISEKEVKLLGGKNTEVYDNFWIEKYQYGKYRIYANKNWEKTISKLAIDKISKIELDPDQFKTDQVTCVKFKASKHSDYNITRFNPESIYRSRYWVIQKKIIDQLVTKGDSILLIQRYEEIEVLSKYFEEQGYYIPKPEISLGRRLELLHRYKKKEKLIIAHVNDADAILKLNHSYPINLVVDSFNLVDGYYCANGTSFFNKKIAEGTYQKKKLLNDDASEDEDVDNLENASSYQKDVFLKDSFFLLKLLRPRITHLRNLLQLNNHENTLWLLDPRIEDYMELGKQWNVTRKFIYGWDNQKEYEEDVLEAENYIQSPKPNEIPFSVEESMEIIRKVFIPKYQWKQEQIPYLKKIIGTNEDWLVSLPTGVGKSVLFQGPAIFKSAFTNRLTIVITPLKALMEDHAYKLWELGFFGCVDYLNSDRSSDTELIYRSMAGGELSLLFVTPERFRSRSFLNALDSRIQSDGGLEYIVFDEAHCVSQWGHDFRPDYFNCAKQVWRTKTTSNYPAPLLLFSATVSKKIYQDFNTIFS